MISFTVVNLTLNIALTMGIETGLTFLGFGLPPGTPSLGTLVSHARAPVVLQERLWQWLPAALLILLMMLCINYVGQALNRAADAKRRKV
jgi:peptide/nickel transport system permease protein